MASFVSFTFVSASSSASGSSVEDILLEKLTFMDDLTELLDFPGKRILLIFAGSRIFISGVKGLVSVEDVSEFRTSLLSLLFCILGRTRILRGVLSEDEIS
jgi:hypothetical protein